MISDDSHKEFNQLFIDENVYKVLGKSTNVKNIFDNVYYNWDYHIQLIYKITDKDKSNYTKAIEILKNNKQELTVNNVIDTMLPMDEKYKIPKLLQNTIRIIQDSYVYTK